MLLAGNGRYDRQPAKISGQPQNQMKDSVFSIALITFVCFFSRVAVAQAPSAATGTATTPAATAPPSAGPAREVLPEAPKTPQQILASRTYVKEYKLDELAPLVTRNINRGRNFEKGKQLFSDLACIACHHFGPDGGGIGPDLTGVSGRYTPKDLLEEILDPSKSVSSLYASSSIRKKNGETISGRVTAEGDNEVSIMEDLFNPAKLTVIKRTDIESMGLSEISPMPEGLLYTAKEEEIYDLVAYLLSGGDPKDNAFRPPLAPVAPAPAATPRGG